MAQQGGLVGVDEAFEGFGVSLEPGGKSLSVGAVVHQLGLRASNDGARRGLGGFGCMAAGP